MFYISNSIFSNNSFFFLILSSQQNSFWKLNGERRESCTCLTKHVWYICRILSGFVCASSNFSSILTLQLHMLVHSTFPSWCNQRDDNCTIHTRWYLSWCKMKFSARLHHFLLWDIVHTDKLKIKILFTHHVKFKDCHYFCQWNVKF